jgi:hypothetical protein
MHQKISEQKNEKIAAALGFSFKKGKYLPTRQGSQNLTKFFLVILYVIYDLNGSVGSIADLKPKGQGFESRISQGFFLM